MTCLQYVLYSKTMKSKSFLIYKHLMPVVMQLSDEDAGAVLKAMMQYENSNGQDEPEGLSDQSSLVFSMFKIYLDKARVDYARKCETNKANASGRKRTDASEANINTSKNKNNKWKGVD